MTTRNEKRAIKCFSLAVAAAMCFSLSQAAFALGPTGVVNYDFSEGSGTMPQDTSPNNNDGTIPQSETIIGGGTFGVSGAIGTGLKLNGVDDWAQFESPDFDPSASGTFNFWVNLVTSPATRQAFLGVESNSMKLEFSSSSRLNSRPSGVGTDETLQSAGTMTTGVWYNVQMTWNHNGGTTTGTNSIYINGTEITYNASFTSDITGWTPASLANLAVSIGRRHDANDRFLGATIDDVAFYSTALSTSDMTLIRTAATGAAALTTNQIVHWNLDDTAGTTIAPSDGGSVAIDLLVGAGTVNPIAVTYLPAGGPTLVGGSYAAAQTLDAVDFSGAQHTGNRIVVADSASLDFDKTQGSVVVWVNLDNQFNRMGLLRDSTGQMQFEIHSNGRVFFQIGSRVEGTGGTVSPFIAVNTWTHLAFVWDNNAATNDIMQIYLNGTLATHDAIFGTQGTFTVPPNTGDWIIGHRPDILNRNFDGQMADFAMFDVALTADEINDIILNGALPTWTPVQEPQPQPQPGTGGGGGAIPEPASLALLGLSALALMRRRRQ